MPLDVSGPTAETRVVDAAAGEGGSPPGRAHDALEDLRRKYVEMLEMRRDHARGDEDPRAVRVRMARLAERFPGSLREIDDLELPEIERRIAEIDVVLVGEREAAPWMRAVAGFHALTRGALGAKRWLGRRGDASVPSEQEFRLASASFPFPEDALVWAGELAAIARPPRGRLTDLVFGRLAAALAVPEEQARQLVFGVPRRVRRR